MEPFAPPVPPPVPPVPGTGQQGVPPQQMPMMGGPDPSMMGQGPMMDGGMSPMMGDPSGMSGILAAMGIDPASLAPPPQERQLVLPAEEVESISRDIEQILATHEDVMRKRRKREEEIEDAYALIPNRKAIGDYPGASDIASEMVMATVDQAKARISSQILSVEPLVRVEPLDSVIARQSLGDEPAKFAKALERFADRYVRVALDIERFVPAAALRFTKLGTAVVHADWTVESDSFVFPGASEVPQVIPRRKGKANLQLLPNSDVMVWPPWSSDWQKDYEWVGHRSHLSAQGVKKFARRLGMPREAEDELLALVAKPSPKEGYKAAEAAGMNVQSGTDDKLTGVVKIWEIWAKRYIGGLDFPYKLKLFWCEDLKKVLAVYMNPNRNGRHPYFPIRYKVLDQSAWGNGIGHELFPSYLADSAFRNLELDNLYSTCFSLTLVKSGSTLDAMLDRPYPGMRVATEDPAGDLDIKSFATSGPLEMLYQAAALNDQRKSNATGLAAVLTGQGDPVMKSGGGTGSTLALIEQAGKKFGEIDASIRRDITPLYVHVLDLFAQYSNPQDLENYAPLEDIQLLSQIFGMPPGSSISSTFKMVVEAPSAANNRELQKQNAMVVWNFILQTSQQVMQLAMQIFPQMNPAGMIPYLVQWMKVMETTGQEVIDLHEMPGMRDLLPRIPTEPSPEQQMINTLLQQLQSLQQQVQALGGGAAGGGGEGTPSPAAPPPGGAA